MAPAAKLAPPHPGAPTCDGHAALHTAIASKDRAGTRLWPWAVAAVIVVLTVVVPRLWGLSGLPLTDEGYYAFYAMRMHASLAAGQGLPGDGYLMLYPLLSSWAWSLPGNPLVVVRGLDMIIASAAGLLLFQVLRRESGSAIVASLLSLVFLWAMNAAPFIQNGYKNSFFVAYVPLFLALVLSQRSTVSTARWALIGGLVACGVLLRESFVPFSVLAVIAVWVGYGRCSVAALCGGALAATTFMLSLVFAARGGVHGLIESYQDAALTFSAIREQRTNLFVAGLKTALSTATLPIFLWAAAVLAAAVAMRSCHQHHWRRGAFWLLASLLPLIEPASKIGFAYHFSACLPGMAGLCAWAWQFVPSRRVSAALVTVITVAASWFVSPLWAHAGQSTDSIVQARRVYLEGWSIAERKSTNYLIAADRIDDIAPHGGTMSVSGFMFPLYPLTRLQPVSPEMTDLSLALIKLNMEGPRLQAAIERCPADVIIASNRTEFPGATTLVQAIEATGLYTRARTIEVVPDRAYGTFGGTLYRRIGNHPVDCR